MATSMLLVDPASPMHVVVIDQDNVRASMRWPAPRDFRDAVCRWANSTPGALVLIAVDERRRAPSRPQQQQQQQQGDGLRPGVHERQRCLPLSNSVLATFSGPRWCADDVIARDTEWWLRKCSGCRVLVVSSDRQVRRRCREAQQRLGAGALSFETGEALGMQLTGPRACGSSAPPPQSASAASAPAPARSAAAVEFADWVQTEQPRPFRTASEVVHAGERERSVPGIGKKRRKLGVKR